MGLQMREKVIHTKNRIKRQFLKVIHTFKELSTKSVDNQEIYNWLDYVVFDG